MARLRSRKTRKEKRKGINNNKIILMNGENMFEALKLKYKMARMSSKMIVDGMEKMIRGNDKAEAPVKAIIGLFILAILAGALVPTAMTSLHAADTTNWTTSEIATYGIIAIMVLVAVVVLIAKIATE